MHKLPSLISSAVSFEIVCTILPQTSSPPSTTQGVEVHLGLLRCPNNQNRVVQHFLNGELLFPCKLKYYWYYLFQHCSFCYCSPVINFPGLVSSHSTHIRTFYQHLIIWSEITVICFLIKYISVAAFLVAQHQQMFAFYSLIIASVHRIHSTSK